MNENLYATLGVAFDAEPSAIRAAYRKLAQKNHPDKGGDREVMQAIQQAYDILSDVVRRARYDAGESLDQVPTLREKAAALLASLLESLFDAAIAADVDVAHKDIVQECRDVLHGRLQKAKETQISATKRIAMRQKALARLSFNGTVDYAASAIEQQISVLHEQMKKIEHQIEIGRETLDLLAEYEYRHEPAASSFARAFYA